MASVLQLRTSSRGPISGDGPSGWVPAEWIPVHTLRSQKDDSAELLSRRLSFQLWSEVAVCIKQDATTAGVEDALYRRSWVTGRCDVQVQSIGGLAAVTLFGLSEGGFVVEGSEHLSELR